MRHSTRKIEKKKSNLIAQNLHFEKRVEKSLAKNNRGCNEIETVQVWCNLLIVLIARKLQMFAPHHSASHVQQVRYWRTQNVAYFRPK